VTADPRTSSPTGRRTGWRIARTAVAIGITVPSVVVLSRQARHLPDTAGAMALADGGWLATAAGLSVASMLMLAGQQLLLMRALGIRMPAPRALAITYAQTSITLTVPGGSAVATAFAVRRLRTVGASVDAAVGVVALSGAASVLGLACSYAVGAVIAGSGGTPGPLWISVAVAVLTLTLTVPAGIRSLPAMVVRRWQRRVSIPDRRVRAPAFVVRRWRRMRRSRRLGRDTLAALLALRERDWYLAVLMAALNWIADIAALVAAARSLHIGLDLRVVGVAYLTVQAGRYLSLLPGGLGVVEPTLVVILSTADVRVPAAVGVVLIYRLFSYWLVALVGLPLWLRPDRKASPGRWVDEHGEDDAVSARGRPTTLTSESTVRCDAAPTGGRPYYGGSW